MAELNPIKKDMKSIPRLLTIWVDYRKWLLLSIVLTIGGGLGTLAIPALSETMINEGIMAGDLSVMIRYGGYMLALTLVAAGCMVANTLIAVRFSEYTAHYLRTSAYNHIQELSFGNLDRLRPSDLLVRLTTDIQNIKIAIQQGILNLPLVPVMLILTILLVAFRSPSLIGLMLALLVIFSLMLGAYLWIVLPVFTARQEKYDEMSRALQENMAGVRVVKAFVRQDLEDRRFRQISGAVRHASLRAQTCIAILIPSMLLVVNLSLAAIFFVGGKEVLLGTGFSTGEVVASIQYMFLLIMPFSILGTVLPAISAARPSLDRVFGILDATADVQDAPGASLPADVKGRLVFDHVSFGYRSEEGQAGPPVLEDISFSAEPGQTIGILGPTGCGKSTLVNLIPRFYDVTSGSITIDGTDIRKIPQDQLRGLVAICLQQPNLFFGTIRENLLFSATDRSEENLIASAEAADADGFIRNIPLGYDDAVARRGANFSGGQRQRMAIARTLAADPKILILDDSTSACDVATEGRIQDAIGRRFSTVTRILVAQRVSAVIAAERILLMENGRIIASGTHEELLRTSSSYREIYDSQLGSGITSGVAS